MVGLFNIEKQLAAGDESDDDVVLKLLTKFTFIRKLFISVYYS